VIQTSAIAIILARAGSKGVPGKNHAIVGGKPCIAHTIEQAQRSARVGRVIVSTDDAPCTEIARELGCTVIERPDELAHDTATIDSAARHAYESIGSPDAPIVILYANVPIRPEPLIDDALAMLENTGCDSVQSFAKVGKHHPWWTCRIDEQGTLRAFMDGAPLFHNCFRRQDLPDALIPDGGVMAVTPGALMCTLGAPDGPHAFLGTDRRAIVTNEGDVIDIDSPIDLVVADTLLKERFVHAHR
jgi:CMP-N-acetylneuraminic acid synthetase